MTFFTFLYGRSLRSVLPIIVLWLSYSFTASLQAQDASNSAIPVAQPVHLDDTAAAPITNVALSPAPTTNVPPAQIVTPSPTPVPVATPVAAPVRHMVEPVSDDTVVALHLPAWMILASLMTLASVGGFLLYQCGLTRAKNCAHTSTLLVIGVAFGWIGYWAGGFAVQTGGVGDAHAALAESLMPAAHSGLDHELGLMVMGHHWGLMGSSGFFLISEAPARNGTAALFLNQAALLAITLAAALGAALERGRLLAMAVTAFVIGAVIYPLFANWVWGGGWLAELGREYGLGHGFVDLGGACVVHQTAGTLAFVIALVIGPRYGRFGLDNKPNRAIPGHNVPFLLLGTFLLVLAWTVANAFAFTSPIGIQMSDWAGSSTGLAAVNALLAAISGLLVSFLVASWRRQRPEPALLCRGLLAGVISVSGCSALIDPWAAFFIGGFAGWLVYHAMTYLVRLRLDDPVGTSAVHGAAGAWGALATGIFANGSGGYGLNGVGGPVKGLLFGGAWHQLVAQFIGCVTGFVATYILGYACLVLIQKILSLRVELADEVEGLDWSETGALGYQPDLEPDGNASKD